MLWWWERNDGGVLSLTSSLLLSLFLFFFVVKGGDELVEPDEIVLSSTITELNVSKCWWNIEDKVDIQTRCYCYWYQGVRKCTVPGPTLIYTAGEDAFIRVTNELVGSDPFDNEGFMVIEDLISHDPDVTNLHTHGLHVDPAVDDVVDIAIAPGESHDYNFTILSDHYPGVHWYHDHWHGAVTFHVHTGLFGAIIMKSSSDQDRNLLDMTSRTLILHGLSLNNDSLNAETGECACGGYNDWFDGGGNATTNNPLQLAVFHLTTICDQWCDMYCYQRNLSETPPRQVYNDYDWLNDVAPQSHINWDGGITLFMVNGQVHPKITIGQDEWVRLRIINADAQGSFMLHFPNSAACDYYFIGTDGIFFDSVRDLSMYPYLDYVFIPMAGRIEMVVKCSEPGNYDVRQVPENPEPSFYNNISCNPTYNATALLFTLVVDENAPSVATSFNPNMTFPEKTGYLADTTNLTSEQYLTNPVCTHYNATAYPNVFWTMHPDVFTSAIRDSCTAVTVPTQFGNETFTGALFGINGEYFRHDSSLATFLPDSVYEMTVAFGPHPFHHHINPFQLQHGIADGFIAQKGDWRDVLSSGCQPGSFRARVRTVDYTGKVIMHCHFLPHEDRGLMGYYTISSASCTSTPGHGLPKEDKNSCVKESSPHFCLGPIASGAVMLKVWNLVLVSVVMGVVALL